MSNLEREEQLRKEIAKVFNDYGQGKKRNELLIPLQVEYKELTGDVFRYSGSGGRVQGHYLPSTELTNGTGSIK